MDWFSTACGQLVTKKRGSDGERNTFGTPKPPASLLNDFHDDVLLASANWLGPAHLGPARVCPGHSLPEFLLPQLPRQNTITYFFGAPKPDSAYQTLQHPGWVRAVENREDSSCPLTTALMRSSWQKTHLYLFTFSRYFLATIILMYAFGKIVGTQFSSQPSVYDRPVGSLSGFELTWFYYGYSHWYGLFLAGSQITAALLLFFRRTTRLGVLLYLAIMANIVAVDFAYDIRGAKGMAVLLAGLALFVFLSEWPLFYRYFLVEPPLFDGVERPSWFNRARRAKLVYIPAICLGFWLLITTLKAKIMTQNQFYGTWQVSGHEPTWNRLHFEAGSTFSVYEPGQPQPSREGHYQFDEARHELRLQVYKPQSRQSQEANDVLHPDSTQLETFFAGRYELEKQQLRLRGQDGKLLTFTRIR